MRLVQKQYFEERLITLGCAVDRSPSTSSVYMTCSSVSRVFGSMRYREVRDSAEEGVEENYLIKI